MNKTNNAAFISIIIISSVSFAVKPLQTTIIIITKKITSLTRGNEHSKALYPHLFLILASAPQVTPSDQPPIALASQGGGVKA